ncbi:MAG: glycosyltransferase WbuB [Alphaproteobacteria bacterium]|nr:glycosyltransferase WbuB [Alphaproteobacteria bacterium]
MRVLLLVDSYYPEIRSAPKLIRELAEAIHASGHQVTILAPSAQLDREFSIEDTPTISIARVLVPRTKGRTKPLRALIEVLLSTIIWRHAKLFLQSTRHDLIVFYSPTIFFSPLVARLKQLWSCPAYLVLRDIFPQWAAEIGVLSRRSPIYAFFTYAAKKQYLIADRIGVQSPGDIPSLSAWRGKVEVLYNWSASRPATHQSLVGWRERLQLGDRFVFFFGGNIGSAQEPVSILRLAQRLQDRRDIAFLLVGDGDHVPLLRRQIATLRLDNVRLLPTMPEPDYFALLSEINVGVVSLHPNLRTHNIPAKFLGYLAAGKAVLARLNRGHDLVDIFATYGVGLCCVSGDDDAFCDAALRLANHRQATQQMGSNGLSLLRTLFSPEQAARQILACPRS